MKKNIYSFLIVLTFPALYFACIKSGSTQITPPPVVAKDTFPQPDHIIFVWFENKEPGSIVSSTDAPFINELISKGTLFTNMHGVTHPSYPNYMNFFAGQNNGITSDACVTTLFTTPNLYTTLTQSGKSFAWYSEDLPATGSNVCKQGRYVAKHNPTSVFANVPASQNKMLSSLPADFNLLENVVCITPNLDNDMHDGSVATGDTWLQNNLGALSSWCTTHNSIFVVYFDEDDGSTANFIPVVALGAHVKTGFTSANNYDHFSWTKTVCEMFEADSTWSTNLQSANVVKGCWQ